MWLVFVIEGQRPDQVLSGVDIECDDRPYQTHDQTRFTEGFEVLRLTSLCYANQVELARQPYLTIVRTSRPQAAP
jgi:hypothetical protein